MSYKLLKRSRFWPTLCYKPSVFNTLLTTISYLNAVGKYSRYQFYQATVVVYEEYR